MGWTEFAASVIGDLLSWPVVVLVLVLLLLGPIRKLIGRVKGAKGFGGEVEFSELLERAEENVDDAIDANAESQAVPQEQTAAPQQAPTASGSRRGADSKVPDPSSDPSGAIIVAWQELVETLNELARANAGKGRPASNPAVIIDQLRRNKVVSEAFYKSAVDLMKLRNQVAHGEVAPTQGAARTYVERVGQLGNIATGMMAVQRMDLDKPFVE